MYQFLHGLIVYGLEPITQQVQQSGMSQSILIIYQDIDSGAKVVTEKIIIHLKKIHPLIKLIVYKQNPFTFSGPLSAIKNFLWSFFDCLKTIILHRQTFSVIYTPYYLAAFAGIVIKSQNQSVVVHFHGDHAITKIDPQTGYFRHLKFGYIWLFGKIITYLQTTALAAANAVIFVTQEARHEIAHKYHLSALTKHSFIIPNGVSLALYHPKTDPTEKAIGKKILAKNQISPHTTVLLYSGRIDQKKGVNLIFEAMRKLKKNYPHKKYVLFILYPNYKDKDSALYFQYLQKLQKDYDLHVTFVPQVKSLRPYYQIADICLLPSEQEMMPLVMLESLACGTPFLGTKVGNIPKILEKITPHLILKQQTAEAVVKNITWWQSLSLREKHHIRSQCHQISQTYSWETTTQKVMAVLRQQLR
jgi:glycosyltransferase involved in cell wall biosynthesis